MGPLPRPLPPPSAQAFSLPISAEARRGSALLIHGYTGCPYEVRVLADDLHHRLGFACEAPLLPGHGDDPAHLNHLKVDDFRQAAFDAWDALVDDDPHGPKEGRPRIIVGSSMGGLLALQVAAARDVDAVILLAPALRMFEAPTAAVAFLSLGLWHLRPFTPKEGPGGDVGAVDGARLNPTYKVMPTGGLTTFMRLQWNTERLLRKVTAPLCTLHGALDHTIPPSASRRIAARVSSSVVEYHRLARTQHLVGLDVERDLVSDLVVAFLRRTLTLSSTATASTPPSPAPAEAPRVR